MQERTLFLVEGGPCKFLFWIGTERFWGFRFGSVWFIGLSLSFERPAHELLLKGRAYGLFSRSANGQAHQVLTRGPSGWSCRVCLAHELIFYKLEGSGLFASSLSFTTGSPKDGFDGKAVV